MLLDPIPDQEFLRETTERFLRDHVPPDEARRLRDDPAGFESAYWRQGAELGWTSLLVDEAHGGGSISGQGLVDLTLIAHEVGAHAAPGPLTVSNVVAAALSAADSHPEVLAGILDGSVIATWCFAEGPPNDGLDDGILEIRADGSELVVSGEKRPVEAAGRADHLLVTGRSDGGMTQVLVAADTPGVSITPMHTVDLTRRYGVVRFDDVRVPVDAVVGDLGGAASAVARQLDQALVIVNAETVGAMQHALDMTVEWAFDRYSFGRPLASYQALKHRFANMKTWLEASHAISDEAAVAVAGAREGASEFASAAKAYVGDQGAELAQDCVQMHGGIGVTFEHDLHLYLRRITVNRATFGTPAEHRRRLGVRMLEEEAS